MKDDRDAGASHHPASHEKGADAEADPALSNVLAFRPRVRPPARRSTDDGGPPGAA